MGPPFFMKERGAGKGLGYEIQVDGTREIQKAELHGSKMEDAPNSITVSRPGSMKVRLRARGNHEPGPGYSGSLETAQLC